MEAVVARVREQRETLTATIGNAIANARMHNSGRIANGASIRQYHVCAATIRSCVRTRATGAARCSCDLARCLTELGTEEAVVEPTDTVEVRDEDLRGEHEPGAGDATRCPRRCASRPAGRRRARVPPSTTDGGEHELPVAVGVDHDRYEQADDRSITRPNASRRRRVATGTPRSGRARRSRARRLPCTLSAMHRRDGEPPPSFVARAAQYANSNGPIATASGWKNSHINHWYVGLSSSATASATPHQRDRSTSRPSRNIAIAPLACATSLHGEQDLDAATESIERRDRQQEHVHVVAEEVEAAHRDERIAKLRKEPHTLVVDTEVEPERLEPLVPQRAAAGRTRRSRQRCTRTTRCAPARSVDRTLEHTSGDVSCTDRLWLRHRTALSVAACRDTSRRSAGSA